MKILLGYDGSKIAMDALKLSVKYAAGLKGSVCVVQSLVGGEEDDPEKIQKAEQQLAFAEKAIQAEGIPCESHLLIRTLTPGEDIVNFARENGIDLIVIGVKRRSKVGKLFFGSNAQFVILNAHCPVLTIR